MNDRAAALRQEIMLRVKANNLPVTGELWLTLVFCSESELAAIAADLHIRAPEEAACG